MRTAVTVSCIALLAQILGGGIASVQAQTGATQDEILGQIDEAVGLYKAGDYAEAAAGLEYVAAQIRQLQAGRIAEALPEPLPGWEAKDVETTAVSGSYFGGATGAGREYVKDDARVEIQILGNSPAIQAVLMMVQNPMMISSSGKTMQKVAGQKAIVDYDADSRSGEIQLAVANAVLVTLDGRRISQEDLMSYAENIDYKLIKKMAMGE